VNVNSNESQQPKVKSINPKGDGKGKGKDQQKGDEKGGKGKDDPKGKGKKGKGEPCKYFSLDEGCRFGQLCKAYHRLLKPEEGKCYVCGTTKHMAQDCDRPKRDPSAKGGKKGDGGKKGKPGTKGGKPDGGKGKPTVNKVEKGEAQSSEGRELKRGDSDPKEPENEPVLEAFQSR
jgi:hypothetical protein